MDLQLPDDSKAQRANIFIKKKWIDSDMNREAFSFLRVSSDH